MKYFIIFVLSALLLVACGSPKPNAQETAVQIVEALDQGDVATLNKLFDDEMPLKEAEIKTKQNSWRDDIGAIGPLVRLEPQEPQTSGESTIVLVKSIHERGEQGLSITLHETNDGWRALAWSYAGPYQRYEQTP